VKLSCPVTEMLTGELVEPCGTETELVERIREKSAGVAAGGGIIDCSEPPSHPKENNAATSTICDPRAGSAVRAGNVSRVKDTSAEEREKG